MLVKCLWLLLPSLPPLSAASCQPGTRLATRLQDIPADTALRFLAPQQVPPHPLGAPVFNVQVQLGDRRLVPKQRRQARETMASGVPEGFQPIVQDFERAHNGRQASRQHPHYHWHPLPRHNIRRHADRRSQVFHRGTTSVASMAGIAHCRLSWSHQRQARTSTQCW